MTPNTERVILVVAAVAGTALAIYTAYKAAHPTMTPAPSPVVADTWQTNLQQNAEQWFASLWGSRSSGGTPEAATTYPS